MQSHSLESPSSWQNQSVSSSGEVGACALAVDPERHPDIATMESASIKATLTRVVGMAGYFADPHVICQRLSGAQLSGLSRIGRMRRFPGAES